MVAGRSVGRCAAFETRRRCFVLQLSPFPRLRCMGTVVSLARLGMLLDAAHDVPDGKSAE